MTAQEQRIKALKMFFLIKTVRIEKGLKYQRVYYKFRKWHPLIIAISIYSILYHICKEAYIETKVVIHELDEVDYTQIEVKEED